MRRLISISSQCKVMPNSNLLLSDDDQENYVSAMRSKNIAGKLDHTAAIELQKTPYFLAYKYRQFANMK